VKSIHVSFKKAEELFEAVKKSAKQNRRSMNAEVLRAIEYYLKNAPEAHYQVEPAKVEEPNRKAESKT
jgi:hypothetical protein